MEQAAVKSDSKKSLLLLVSLLTSSGPVYLLDVHLFGNLVHQPLHIVKMSCLYLPLYPYFDLPTCYFRQPLPICLRELKYGFDAIGDPLAVGLVVLA
jgi:hypothetical protein